MAKVVVKKSPLPYLLVTQTVQFANDVHQHFYTIAIEMKFNLKRSLFTTLACTLFLVPLAGCGGAADNSAVTDDADAAAIAEYERLDAESEEAANNDDSE